VVSMSTTSGVVLRHGVLERLTLANHRFPTTEVYHPDIDGVMIGQITHRLPALDIAFAKLMNPSRYTNNRYFEGPVPVRLLRHSEFGLEWCTLDGMTTGLVYLLQQYDRICERTEDDALNEVGGTHRTVW
jgi:hypothetical protein